MPIKPLDGDAPLTKSNLSLSLTATCRAVASALVKGGAKLDEELLENEIPGQVLQVAIQAHWLPQPPKAKKEPSVVLAGISVSEKYRDQLLELLAPVYEELKLREYRGCWMEPTPRQWIKRFKNSTGWSDQRLADEVRRVYSGREAGDREAISVKTIRRIQNLSGHNARPEILQALAEVVIETATSSGWQAGFRWRYLQWRPKEAEK